MQPAPGSPSSGVRRTASARRGLSDATIRRIEQATGRLATQSVARMDEELAWFRELPADQRSWVTLVAQAGMQSYVDWLRSPDDVLRLTGEVFATAPRAMARSVTLQQTVELVRQTIAVAEDEPAAARRPGGRRTSCARSCCGSAARSPSPPPGCTPARPRAAGSWDDRLEALVIDRLVSGAEVGDPLPSQLAALGWRDAGPIGGGRRAARRTGRADVALADVHRSTRRAGRGRDGRRARRPAGRRRRRRRPTRSPSADDAAAGCSATGRSSSGPLAARLGRGAPRSPGRR